MKTCTECTQNKTLTEFHKHRSSKDGHTEKCKQCRCRRESELREMRLVRERRRRWKIRELIQQAKDKPCADCNESYPYYVMDFDHARGEKSFNLSRASSLTYRLERVQSEIEKCDVVCSNCHRIRTYRRNAK